MGMTLGIYRLDSHVEIATNLLKPEIGTFDEPDSSIETRGDP